jgi:hypothetical protein
MKRGPGDQHGNKRRRTRGAEGSRAPRYGGRSRFPFATRCLALPALFGLYGVSVLLAGFFTIDVGGEATMVGTIHNIVGNISFFGFPIAAILLSLGIGKDQRWRSFLRPLLRCRLRWY